MERFRPYLPVLALTLAAWVAVSAPLLTAFLVASLLLLGAMGYGWVVYQLQKGASPWRQGPVREPSFRNVTTVMRTRWVRDLN